MKPYLIALLIVACYGLIVAGYVAMLGVIAKQDELIQSQANYQACMPQAKGEVAVASLTSIGLDCRVTGRDGSKSRAVIREVRNGERVL
jgi:hypothetical protein